MIHHVYDTANLQHGMCQQVLSHELNKQCTVAKYVIGLLSNDQNKLCIAMFSEVHEESKNYPSSISTIIIGDESCDYRYDPKKAATISVEDEEWHLLGCYTVWLL
jgi:hypothetical protein